MPIPIMYQIATRARALIADPASWTRGVAARNRSKKECSATSDDAVRFSAIGALHRAAYELTGDAEKARRLGDRAACIILREVNADLALAELHARNVQRGRKHVLRYFDRHLHGTPLPKPRNPFRDYFE